MGTSLRCLVSISVSNAHYLTCNTSVYNMTAGYIHASDIITLQNPYAKTISIPSTVAESIAFPSLRTDNPLAITVNGKKTGIRVKCHRVCTYYRYRYRCFGARKAGHHRQE